VVGCLGSRVDRKTLAIVIVSACSLSIPEEAFAGVGIAGLAVGGL
jgi:hypothetical protein